MNGTLTGRAGAAGAAARGAPGPHRPAPPGCPPRGVAAGADPGRGGCPRRTGAVERLRPLPAVRCVEGVRAPGGGAGGGRLRARGRAGGAGEEEDGEGGQFLGGGLAPFDADRGSGGCGHRDLRH
ncbi:hypothetical protein SGPA1_11011 [Streptomyces misionensis JCM 4497]